MNKLPVDGYSANVQIHLHVQGHKLQVARIRGGMLTLRDRCDVAPSSEAKIVISVDGREDVLPVVLSKGIDSRSDVVEFF